MGEHVYFTGTGETLASGNQLEHGEQGEVVGPATCKSSKGKCVVVRFPGNKGAISCYLTEVRRRAAAQPHPQLPAALAAFPPSPSHTTGGAGAQVSREPPPPLLGGYAVGEQVYYTGVGDNFENGNWLEHGEQGEVVGPATLETQQGKGVMVRFPGNNGAISCYLFQVRHRRRSTATHSSPPHQLPPLPAHPRYVARGRTGEPRAATTAAGWLRGGRAGLLHGDG